MLKKCTILLLVLMQIMIYIAPVQAYSMAAPEYCEGTAAASSIYSNDWIYSGALGAPIPTITSIKVSWNVPPGDSGVIEYRDSNRQVLPTSSTIDMSQLTNKNFVITPPTGAVSANLILNTNYSSITRWLWFNEIDFSDGNTDVFPDPAYAPKV